MFMIFDTETTGVPSRNYRDWSVCHIVQIAWIIVDESFRTIKSESFLIKDGGQFQSCATSLDCHHITDDERETNGISFPEMMDKFIKDACECKRLVCHGGLFDVGLLVNESVVYRYNCLSRLNHVIVYDTKHSPLYEGFNQSLSATVNRISPEFIPPEGVHLHDATYDSYLCLEIFRQTDYNNCPKMINDVKYYVKRFAPQYYRTNNFNYLDIIFK